jgi:hypothetical protein
VNVEDAHTAVEQFADRGDDLLQWDFGVGALLDRRRVPHIVVLLECRGQKTPCAGQKTVPFGLAGGTCKPADRLNLAFSGPADDRRVRWCSRGS